MTYLLVLVGDPLEDANAQVCKLRECSFGQVDMASRAARAEVGDGHVDVSSLVYSKCKKTIDMMVGLVVRSLQPKFRMYFTNVEFATPKRASCEGR